MTQKTAQTAGPDEIFLTVDETKDFDPCGLPIPDGLITYVRKDIHDTLTAQRDEMLEALRDVVEVFEVEVCIGNPTIRKIKAIISKADGQKVGGGSYGSK